MTFKVKNGLAVGSITVVDQNSYFQQTENAASVTPSLNLNFTNKSLDPRIAFQRSSNATFIAASGLIQNAAANIPRFEHHPITRECKGLLVESDRTNILTWSANTLGGGWTADQAYLLSTAVAAPDGSATVAKLTEGTSSAGYRIMRHDPAGILSGTVYTASIYVKPVEVTAFNLGWYDSSGGGQYAYANFNLSTGAVIDFNEAYANGFSNAAMANAHITPMADGWYRCALRFTTGANTGGSIRVGLNTFATPGLNVSGMYVWGGQLEIDSMTSFIYTTTAAATRQYETVIVANTNFNKFYNPTEGTVYAKWTESCDDSLYGVFGITDGTGSNRIDCRRQSNTSIQSLFSTQDVTMVGVGSSVVRPAGVNNVNQFAVAYKVNDVAASLNGNVAHTGTISAVPQAVNQLALGQMDGNYGYAGSISISQFVYYPKRLDNATLVNITTN